MAQEMPPESVDQGAAPIAAAAVAAPIATAPISEPTSEARKKKLNLPDHYRGIVRVEVAKKSHNYAMPWQAGSYGGGTGTAFMVGKGLFMTNAHVVADAARIHISPYADARKIPARVKFVAHDADLALIEIDDTTPFDGIAPLHFSDDLPHLEDEVRAVGYPIGGARLSVTRGIVSRIENTTYSHPRNSAHLTVQVDAAINPGNSGGPVFKGTEVIGVAFQGLNNANSTGYIIPAPVIKRFLKDIEDGSYDKYVELGASFFPIQNPGMRRHFKLPNNGQGVLVSDIIKGSSCDGVLELGDVVFSINNYSVDSSGMIELDGERLKLEELAERSFKDDKIKFNVLRQGKMMELSASLAPKMNSEVTGINHDASPRYVTFGGFVFQPLQLNEIIAHKLKASGFIVEMDEFLNHGASIEKNDIVVATRILPDEVNSAMSNIGRGIVTKVNGVELRGLSHLYELLYEAKEGEADDFICIEFLDAPRPMVFERKSIEAANARIMDSYGITAPAQLKDKP